MLAYMTMLMHHLNKLLLTGTLLRSTVRHHTRRKSTRPYYVVPYLVKYGSTVLLERTLTLAKHTPNGCSLVFTRARARALGGTIRPTAVEGFSAEHGLISRFRFTPEAFI